MKQTASMKLDREQQQRAEMLKGWPIKEIIEMQNVPRLVERWKDLKIMSPSAYLAAVFYYFVFNTVDQKKTLANQTVADLFKVCRSNLHRTTSGRKSTGGSTEPGKKVKSLQELEEHGKSMVKVAKVKTKGAQKVKVMKTAVTPKLIPLPFLDETPALGMRGAWKKKEEDEKPMVH